jgi:hypothetical protein
MSNEPSKAELEARLRETEDAMESRLESIQSEVESAGDSVRDLLVRNPLYSVGGAVAAGLLVGYLFGGSKKRRLQKRHRQLVGAYLDAVRDEVKDAIGEGEDVEQAVRGTLKERVPLVVYENRDTGERSGLIRELFEIVARTGFSLLARDVIESVLANVNIDEALEEDIF